MCPLLGRAKRRASRRSSLGRDEGEENDEVQEETAVSGKTNLVLELIKCKLF